MSTETRKYELKQRAESQEETRRRIVRATMELHEEVGPARTTVAEIARRAGVQRPTVYNHFPDDGELFAACSGLYMSEHPFPELGDALALENPVDRAREVLRRVYGQFRKTEPMAVKVQRDRLLLPALDERVKQTVDAPMGALAAAVSGGFGGRGKRAQRISALARVALDFWTWRRLKLEGLDDEAAADLMAETIAAAATRP